MAALTKQQSWDTFVSWCAARGLCAAPAHPWTLSAYLRSLEGEMQHVSIERHLNLIGQMHFEKLRKRPDRDPMVQRTMAALRTRMETKRLPPPPALFRPDDFLEDRKPLRRPMNDTKPSSKGRRALRSEPRLVRKKRI